MGRAPCCDKANVKKGPWSPEEDAKLKSYIDQYGTGCFEFFCLVLGLKRCGKSCRLRWLNYLRPNIKHGGFSEEEDNIICSLYISIGSRWSIIAAQLPGRTDNDIKNYWNTRLKKKLLGRRKQQQQLHHQHQQSPDHQGSQAAAAATTVEHDHHHHQDHQQSPTSTSNGLSNSALERLQLHMKLQTLNQNPLLHNMLWPKLHPFQEKLLLQAMNDENSNNNIMQLPLLPQPIMMESPLSNIGKEIMINPTNIASETMAMTATTSSNTTTTTTTTTTNGILDHSNCSPSMMNNNNINVSSYGGAFQLGGGDFMMGNLDNGTTSSLVWWSNEFETNDVNYDRSGSFSSSSNDSSWDCALRSSDDAGLF
ncbi:unnamed protein product [Linum tenue]|uniref:Uncharacterized protein n=2 Tax=Linum tenue TaxID=586396 RepID=A0AAV0ICN4_9ROSI|nr:unnamed protein product [Linum tenue]